MNQQYNELKNKYSEFIYHGYNYEVSEDIIKINYEFEIVGLDYFTPSWEFPYTISIDNEIMDKLVFSLGLVELVSYWKLTCASKVLIKCGSLDKEQIQWWKKLYFNGLGEFFYLNNINEVNIDDFMDIIPKYLVECDKRIDIPKSQSGALVPIGGGKDSVVTLELFHSMNENVTTYSVNRINAVKEVIAIDNKKSADILAKRILDKKMIAYNSEGFLNGHTPFSAIVAFSSVITAYLNDIEQIALSNESSANESTVADTNINHQYSKSIEFEDDFRMYIDKIFNTKIKYYSALRPLFETQIAALFAKEKKYHKVFRSCNAGSKVGKWCCDCPKCLFVYIILAPYLEEDELVEIFGENLLDKESLQGYFDELIGISENKPFECVGTREEVLASIMNYRDKKLGKGILIHNSKEYLDKKEDNLKVLLGAWHSKNNLPKNVEGKLMERLDDI